MKLVILNAGPDTGGCGINLKRAFDKHAVGWQTRAICREVVYLDYQTDVVWPMINPPHIRQQVMELVRESDVVHAMDSERALRWIRPYLRGKTIVVHHLGTLYRKNPKAITAACKSYGAIEVTDSIDLLFPHVGWQPVPADFTALAQIREDHYRPSDRIRIVHAPTDRQGKSTAVIVKVIEALAKRYPIDFDLIERVSNRECLIRKARADIFVDQLTIGFGVNAIESWAMGVPVVSGLVDPAARERALAMWGGKFPWADATPATLEPVLEHLVVNRDWRVELGARGKVHGLEWHSEAAVVERTLALYEQAGAQAA